MEFLRAGQATPPRTLVDVLLATALAHPDAPAIDDGEQILTYSELIAVIRRVAPAVATLLGRKLASQAVPVIGAAAGAGLNLAFLSYFRDMARVRFGLERLADRHGAQAVEAQFRAEANSIGLR